MAELIFQNGRGAVHIADGDPISDACEDAGVHFACGEGICGTCILRVVQGGENLSPPTEAEIDFLGSDGVKKERMACQCRITSGEVTVKI